MLHFDGRQVTAHDGRETAPAGARSDMFMDQGKPIPFDDAVQSGHSVGVPGAVRMLEAQLTKVDKINIPSREEAANDPLPASLDNIAEIPTLTVVTALSADEIKQALLLGGSPATLKDVRERFEAFLKERCKGKEDPEKLRFIIE